MLGFSKVILSFFILMLHIIYLDHLNAEFTYYGSRVTSSLKNNLLKSLKNIQKKWHFYFFNFFCYEKAQLTINNSNFDFRNLHIQVTVSILWLLRVS